MPYWWCRVGWPLDVISDSHSRCSTDAVSQLIFINMIISISFKGINCLKIASVIFLIFSIIRIELACHINLDYTLLYVKTSGYQLLIHFFIQETWYQSDLAWHTFQVPADFSLVRWYSRRISRLIFVLLIEGPYKLLWSRAKCHSWIEIWYGGGLTQIVSKFNIYIYSTIFLAY